MDIAGLIKEWTSKLTKDFFLIKYERYEIIENEHKRIIKLY